MAAITVGCNKMTDTVEKLAVHVYHIRAPTCPAPDSQESLFVKAIFIYVWVFTVAVSHFFRAGQS